MLTRLSAYVTSLREGYKLLSLHVAMHHGTTLPLRYRYTGDGCAVLHVREVARQSLHPHASDVFSSKAALLSWQPKGSDG